ncbi:DUF485 domain-containing protein [Amycolatopsis methanolica]|uniref:Integral membrane protein n=1 Tax=Amycolatopsis methanolica 239 TaxID=1068978 RepID=A0A076MVW8_AMYME|nr:DUF485 domain-containing protein [Amycolatopsis methanolica]AIJ24963.1 hypothetical protein AMETH_4871 [Amycolatopsis methanolica 239]
MQNVARTAARNPVEDTGQMRPLFGSSPTTPEPPGPRRRTGPDFVAIQRSEEFSALRSRFRRFVFPMSLAFVLWYLVYVLLAAYAHSFMSIKVFGEVNVGIVLGILQFVSTAAITAAYLRFARRRIDPEVDEVRRQAGVQ